jgi:hypothetical protein
MSSLPKKVRELFQRDFSIQIQNPTTICQDRLSHYSPVLWDRICESLDEKAQRGLIAGAAL